MIHVITPFNRKENIALLSKALEGKADWTVLIDDESLKDSFPSWVTVKLYEKRTKRQGVCIPNSLFNQYISEGLKAETQYMILCDDDSVEEGFFDKIPNEDVVIASMKRGEHVPVGGVGYGRGDLIASPSNIGLGKIGGEQLIVKGKILRDFRYGLGYSGDFDMIRKIVAEYTPVYVPDAYVLFNYFEDGRYDSFRRNPIALFVGDLFCAANPNMGKSEWEGNIWSSLESTGVDVARFHMDKYHFTTGQRGDMALIDRVREIKPDYLILVLYKPLGSDMTVVCDITLDIIANHFKTKIIAIWGDLEAPEQRQLAFTVSKYCWKVIGTASKEITEALGYTYMHVPKDPRIFNTVTWKNNHERDIDIVFSGSYGYGREERQKAIKYLQDNGINIVLGGSEGGDHFTTEEYADRYKRAKIALSFSQARGVNVVNARPFEVMSCGALLLEQESPELAKLYIPYIDYVPWKDEVDLLNKVRYYLSNEDKRKDIALNGMAKTEQSYSADTFWKRILGR